VYYNLVGILSLLFARFFNFHMWRPVLVYVLFVVQAAQAEDDDDGCEEEGGSEINAINLIIAGCLLMLSGLFSGLNLGLMSFAYNDLEVIVNGSTDADEVRYAKTIMPLRKRGNLLLCTLLLGNTLVNALIAVLLADMTSGVVGSILTTVLIVVFGEIGPQSVCSRYALRIGAAAVPIVWCFVGITFIFAFPISLLLDAILGGEVSSVYTKQTLTSLVTLNVSSPEHRKQSGLTEEDGKLLTGALTFRDKKVGCAMTPLADCFLLPLDTVLDYKRVEKLLTAGFTRMPVISAQNKREDIVSVLYMKDLVGLGFERCTPLKDVLSVFNASDRVRYISTEAKLGEAFALFQKDHIHSLVVVGNEEGTKGPALGLITMEDIIEEIIQDEIVDEDDLVVDIGHDGKAAEKNVRRYDPALMIRHLGPPPSALVGSFSASTKKRASGGNSKGGGGGGSLSSADQLAGSKKGKDIELL